MAYEIEIKAHVYNREEVIQKLNSMKDAIYSGHTEKKDSYYHFPVGAKYISARIRKEKLVLNGKTSDKNYFTYKKKKLVTGDDGVQIEANEENEFTFEGDTSPIEVFFEDLGAKLYIRKEKSVEQWLLKADGEEAHVELCTLPDLGDFLEIEIIKPDNSAEVVSKCKKIEETILTECNIPISQIEPRYYTQMLRELKK